MAKVESATRLCLRYLLSDHPPRKPRRWYDRSPFYSQAGGGSEEFWVFPEIEMSQFHWLGRALRVLYCSGQGLACISGLLSFWPILLISRHWWLLILDSWPRFAILLPSWDVSLPYGWTLSRWLITWPRGFRLSCVHISALPFFLGQLLIFPEPLSVLLL